MLIVFGKRPDPVLVAGSDMTICSGTPIFEKGEETGAHPGKLVRSTG
jgi:hypothetical protein